jgi:thiol-disulfide isomerase/thioredoxin
VKITITSLKKIKIINKIIMKNLKISMCCMVLLFANTTFSQTTKSAQDTTRKYFARLAASANESDHALLESKLYELLKSNDEEDWFTASNFFYQMKNVATSDSVQQAIKLKFPNGIAVRNAAADTIYKQKDLAIKEALYNAWIKKFPPENYRSLPLGEDKVVYDYVRSSIATDYAEQNNVEKANYYAGLLQADFWKGNGYAGLSGAFYKSGNLEQAEIYAKKAMESAGSYADGKKGESNAAKFAASGYPGLMSTYAGILFERKKYAEALKYFEMAYKNTTGLNPSLNFRYAQILAGLNRNQEAYDKLEEVVKSGKATPEMTDVFKDLYSKVKGSNAGFDNYMAGIKKSYLEDLKESLTKSMVNERAPGFTLSDIFGNKVSLKDLRGKVVVLDFWATWCGPCKASFPAMQMAQDKFKDDPDVKFLFIHTWERGSDTPTQDAAAYIKSKNYDFEVLMDLKDPDTKENKVVTSYNVKGIPAKFVIDAKGNIRFKLTGFDGSNEAAVAELSMMIDMARAGS